MISRIAKRLAPLHAGRELPGAVLRWLDGYAERNEAYAELVMGFAEDRDRIRQVQIELEQRELGPEMGERFWLEIRRELRTSGITAARGATRTPPAPVADLAPLPAATPWWAMHADRRLPSPREDGTSSPASRRNPRRPTPRSRPPSVPTAWPPFSMSSTISPSCSTPSTTPGRPRDPRHES